MYIESGKVKFYPSAYRQYQDGVETKNINPESELNTEYNITSHIAKLLKRNKGSFIVNYVENNNLEFYLGGYYIHITSPQDILGAFPNATTIWANMKVVPFTPTDNTKGFSELYEVVDYEDNGKNIDEINNNVVSFKGVAFLDTKDSNATFSLCLFSRKDTKSSWHTHTSSEYILDTSEIYNENSDTDISSEFYSLKIKTDDLYAKLGKIDDATINNTLTANGTSTFNKQVDFKGNLVPTNNNQVNIGSSDKEFANIYVNKIMGVSEVDNGQNNITLKSSIVPSGNVNLGSTDNPITSLHTRNISGANLIEAQEIEVDRGSINTATIHYNLDVIGDATFGTSVEFAGDLLPASGNQIDLGRSETPIANIYADRIGVRIIDLKSQIIPDGDVTLGLANNPITNIYATNIYGTNLKDVNAIDGGQNSITLKSDIYPNGQVNLGGSTSKFNQIYATETISDELDTNSLNVNNINSGSSLISLYKTILPTSTGTISLGNNNLKFGGIYATTFYGSLSGNASTATKLNGTSVGGTKNPIYFSNGVPVASQYNSTLYDRIERESTFNNVLSATTSNNNSFITNIPVPSESAVHLNMFAIIYRPSSDYENNRGICTMNFIVHCSANSSIVYSNHIYSYKSILYRLKATRSNISAGLVRLTYVLQYINKSSADNSDTGWADASSERVQDVTVHYTYR